MSSEARPRVLCVDNDEDPSVTLLGLALIEAETIQTAAQASRGFKQNALTRTDRRPVDGILMALDCGLVRRLKQVEVTLRPKTRPVGANGDDSKEKL